MKLRNCILILLLASPLVVLAQEPTGVGLNLLVADIFHDTGHHKLERCVPVVAIAHAQASTGYALTGSSQGKYGW